MSISAAGSSQTSALQTAATLPHRPSPPNWVKDTGSSPTSTTASGGAQGSGGTNPFEKLATDLQAALTALQSGGSATSTATPSSTTDTLTKLQGDLQSLIAKFQSDGTNPSDGTGKASFAHPHHAKETATASASSPAAPASTTEPPAQTFVADILKAFKANFLGDDTSKTSMASPGLGITT